MREFNLNFDIMAEEVYQIVVDSEVDLDDPNLASISNLPNVPFAIQSTEGSLQLQVQDGDCQMELCNSSRDSFAFRDSNRLPEHAQYGNTESHLLINGNQSKPSQLLEPDQQDAIQIPPEVRSLQIQTESGDSMEIVPIHTTKEDGSEEITYIQVGPPSVLAPENLNRMLSLFIEYGPSWKHDLLLDIQSSSSECFEYPVFCKDGIFWASKLLLASVSRMIGVALEQSDADSSLVIPDLKRNDLEIFFNTILESNLVNEKTNSMKKVLSLLCVEGFCEPLEHLEEYTVITNTIDYTNILTPGDKGKLEKYFGKSYHVNENKIHGQIKKENVSAVRLFNTVVCQCEPCERKFSDNKSLQRHIGLVHTNKNTTSNSQSYECPQCNKKFHFAANVKKHIWLVHKQSQMKNFKKSTTVNGKQVEGKKSAVMKEKLEDIKCQLCGKYFLNWKKLQLHMLDHTSDRPYKCDECGKGFKEEAKLKRHMIIHTGEKPFNCSYCSKAFSLKQNKEIHERLHTGEGFGCSYCGEIFSQKVNLKKHEVKHIKSGHQVTESPELRLKQSCVSTKSRLKIDSPAKSDMISLAPKLLILEDTGDSIQNFVVDNNPGVPLQFAPILLPK